MRSGSCRRLTLMFVALVILEGCGDDPAPSWHAYEQKILQGRIPTPKPDKPVTESAVLSSLKWLARHQHSDGHWGAASFQEECNKYIPGNGLCPGRGDPAFDVGVTALSALAFLGAGYTHQSRDVWAFNGKKIKIGYVVKHAVQWLINRQNPDGYVFGEVEPTMWNHAMATLALSEIYGLTASPLFKSHAQKAVDALLAAQHPEGGWGYTIQDPDRETELTVQAIMALTSSEISGLKNGPTGYVAANKWLESVTDADTHNIGYTRGCKGAIRGGIRYPGFATHPTASASAMMARIFMFKNREDPRHKSAAERLMKDLPEWSVDLDGRENEVDFYYWQQASLALFQYDGPTGAFWNGWDEKQKAALDKE